MSWWSSSWLPPLPSIDFALPSGIQKRFISFVLRQTLGRFLKPGQLDIQQVDSQIGSGYVQVRDVELDNEAINSLISDLPLYLHDGSVGKVTARIPWPNPLTSSVGLSVESLHLTFYLSPLKERKIPPVSSSFLAESVVSVADTFIHEELSPPEEAELRESLHVDPSKPAQPKQDHLPGGFDSFLSDGDESRGDADPAGVSIFATLLERLLARFEFDASDLRFTLVHPDHASFTLTIPEIRYNTESKGAGPADIPTQGHEPHRSVIEGVIRSVTISGVSVTTRCLRPSSPVPITPTDSQVSTKHPSITHLSPSSPVPGSPGPPSPYSDNSDLDDDTQNLMSQSIAVFPPRPPSPSSSVASSMYQSAISNASTGRHRSGDLSQTTSLHNDISSSEDARPASSLPPILEVSTNEIEDEMLLSFASDPILLRLITPSTARPPPCTDISPNEESSKPVETPLSPPDNSIRIEVTLGTIGIALRARHIRSLLDVAQLWSSHSPVSHTSKPESTDSSTQSTSLLDNLQGRLQLRGLAILLLPAREASTPNDPDALAEFFRRPVAPPRCSHGYVRLQLEGIGATISSRVEESRIPRTPKTTPSKRMLQSSFWISDLSIFTFISSGSTDLPSDLSALPILITDPRLPSQYPVSHSHMNIHDPDLYSDLPTFDVEDWTHPSNRATSAKLSLWRTRPPHGRPPSVAGSPARKTEDLPPVSPSRPSPMPSSPLKRPVSLAMSISPGKVPEAVQRTQPPALQVNVTMQTTSGLVKTSRGLRSRTVTSTKVEVNLVPLHAFLDFGLLEAKGDKSSVSHTTIFLEELSTPTLPAAVELEDDVGAGEDEEDPEEDDADTPPATPRVGGTYGFQRAEREREIERRRLEKMVLEDLDLGFDYGQSTSRKGTSQSAPRRKPKRKSSPPPEVVVNMPMVRVQIRVPPPPPRLPRSGAIIIDLHNIRLSPGELPNTSQQQSIRFAEPTEGPMREPQLKENAGTVLLTADWQRMIISHCGLDETRAKAILSIGPALIQDPVDEYGVNIQKSSQRPEHSSKPHVIISQSEPSAGPVVKTLAVDVEIPSVHVHLTKAQVDGLQLWADDLTQVIERAFSTPATPQDSKNTSIIGSRFFAKRDRGSGAETTSTISGSRLDARSQTVIKVAVSEAALRLCIPRDSGTAVRPFDIVAADVDMLLEVKPEGKDETVLTLGIMDITVRDTAKSGSTLTFLALTIPRNLSPTVRPLLKLRFASLVVPGTVAKESRVKVTLCGITLNVYPDFNWVADMASFVKAPPGAFESVVPSERTRVEVKLVDTSVRALAPTYPGAIAVYLEEIDFKTVIEGSLPETSFGLSVRSISLFLIDDLSPGGEDGAIPSHSPAPTKVDRTKGAMLFKSLGYALMAELANVDLTFLRNESRTAADSRITVDQATVRVHLCADTATALTAFIGDLSATFGSPPDKSPAPSRERKGPTTLTVPSNPKRNLMASLDEDTFRRIPEVGAAPDMIVDDLPSNLDYLDESFSATAGLREITDDDLDDFGVEDSFPVYSDQPGVVSKHGGETIRMFQPSLKIVEHHFDALPPDANDEGIQFGDTILRVRAMNCDATLFLYDGYDWARTRSIIEEEAKNMRRRLAKIRQLVAEGQTPDPSVEETNTLLFNSVYLGLEHNVDEFEPGALISAIDEELNEDMETASQSSWQSLQPQPMSPGGKSGTKRSRRSKASKRSKGPSIEFKLMNLSAEVDQYKDHPTVASRTLITVQNIEILDHIKTSTWRKFMTALLLDSKGNIRETGSNMARIELRKVYPAPGNPITEARLRAKLLPLKLHVDQDALDFLKKFFAFKDPDAAPPPSTDPADDIFFQQAEVFPVDIKLDYKPRRVDYRALRDGKTIELMNFFHFDGAEMTLRHITLTGITGWPRFFDLLNDLWTPDVKATQLVDVISGVAPIRSVVNVGSGVADLVLLPIAQYRKDGRVVRGLQKGTTAFVKSTAIEAIKLGARLATGTQVILEQAEDVLGGQFRDPITAEALHYGLGGTDGLEELGDDDDLISRYADQPMNVKEGVKSAYKSLKRNLNSAAQTILAVPMEVYERSGNEGTVRAVVRAVPIAVLKPMIGASEAVSKTLLGLHNTLDPTVRLENEAKYKHR